MLDETRVERLDVGAVERRVLDVVEQRVAPVEPVGVEIDGQTVGPAQQNVAEHEQVRAVQVSARDVRRPVPS